MKRKTKKQKSSLITIRITDLRLRTIIGIFEWERKTKQDVTLNIEIAYNAQKAIRHDNISDALDYKDLTKEIIAHVESSQFFLLEKLAATVLDIIMANPLVKSASVRIDKPQAIRFAQSVSAQIHASR